MKLVLIGLAFLSVPALAEPLADFENMVARCKNAYAARPDTEVAYVEPIRAWVKRQYRAPDLAYDVKKSDSLVAPFIAFLEVSDTVVAERADSAEAATALTLSAVGKTVRTTRRFNFAYRANRWELIDGKSTFHSDRPMTISLTKDEILSKIKLPQTACVS